MKPKKIEIHLNVIHIICCGIFSPKQNESKQIFSVISIYQKNVKKWKVNNIFIVRSESSSDAIYSTTNDDETENVNDIE